MSFPTTMQAAQDPVDAPGQGARALANLSHALASLDAQLRRAVGSEPDEAHRVRRVLREHGLHRRTTAGPGTIDAMLDFTRELELLDLPALRRRLGLDGPERASLDAR